MKARLGAGLQALLAALAILQAIPGRADNPESLADRLWQLQQEVLSAQQAGNDAADGNHLSPHYLGWPPGAAEPLTNQDIRSWIPDPGDAAYRCDDLTLTGFTQTAHTALLFWNTRCSDPTQAEPGEYQYASAAVWNYSAAGWQLFTHLGRRKPEREAERYDQAIAAATQRMPALSSGPLVTPERVREQPFARDLLWAAEQEILAGRGRNDFGPYLHYASEHYLAWPPDVPVPMNVATLRRMIDTVTGLENERKSHRFAAYAQSGGTAVIYWHTHRTRTISGADVDHHNATAGVWTFEEGRWRLLGVLSRRKSPYVLRYTADGESRSR